LADGVGRQQRPVVMGPGVRRDDIVGAIAFPLPLAGRVRVGLL
jgi:hypothetical protein